VGRLNTVQRSKDVIRDMVEEYIEAVGRLSLTDA
jgi:hypothetical protein